MSYWDIAFDWLKAYFDWNKQIMIPGFDNVSLFDVKVALFITGIIISGLISIVPNAAYTLGEGASERRQRRREIKAEKKAAAQRESELDEMVHNAVYGSEDK